MRITRPPADAESIAVQQGISSLVRGKGPIALPKPRASSIAQYVTVILCGIALVALISGSIILSQSLKEKRDKIRRNDLFTLRNAIELYKFNHRRHYAPSDESFTEFVGSLAPTFVENLPVDPGDYSYHYVRDPNNPELYTLGSQDEVRGDNATFRYGIGDSSLEFAGIDGDPSTKPARGVEFGFQYSLPNNSNS